MADSYRRGVLAERRVALNYQRCGFVVLERNWRCRAGELDLAVARDSTLVIVEVKCRRSAHFGGPAAAVTETKQSRMRAATAIWLAEHPEWSQRDDVAVRFDVAAVTGGEINILESAF